jgi:hypothetical protein
MDFSECTQQVLAGNFTFPEGIGPVTKMLLAECSIIYLSMSRDEVCIFVTAEDCQYYWKRGKGRISSSYNRLYFRHYIAVADSETLSKLHAANIFEVTRRGVSLAIWGFRITVIPKSIAGVTFVNKLRVICLFEVDFNYWTKLIFARRMMKKAREEGRVPDAVYAKKGSHCDDATMTKVFICDLSRIRRHPAAVTAAGLGDCYNRMVYPPTSIATQSWGVPKSAIKVVLIALQRM